MLSIFAPSLSDCRVEKSSPQTAATNAPFARVNAQKDFANGASAALKRAFGLTDLQEMKTKRGTPFAESLLGFMLFRRQCCRLALDLAHIELVFAD